MKKKEEHAGKRKKQEGKRGIWKEGQRERERKPGGEAKSGSREKAGKI